MKPSEKSSTMEAAMTNMFGFDRRISIIANRCVPAPIGCGKGVTFESFRDEINVRDFKMTGMCQECQDKFDKTGEDE